MYERRKAELVVKKREDHKRRMQDPEFKKRYIEQLYIDQDLIQEKEREVRRAIEIPAREAVLDLIAHYGGAYQTVHDHAKPFRYTKQTERPRINGNHSPLYDVWFVVRGKKTLITVTLDWKSISEEGEETLAEWIGILNEEGIPLYKLAGSELMITDRPDRKILYQTKWAVSLRDI